MLGYFPTKLTLYFEFNLDIYHHEQLHNRIYNVLLAKSTSKVVEMSDIYVDNAEYNLDDVMSSVAHCRSLSGGTEEERIPLMGRE